jgi:hypothetical protein
VSATPILDRLVPLPRSQPTHAISDHGSQFHGFIIAGAILIAIVVAPAYGVLDWMGQWFSATLPGWAVGIRVAAMAAGAVAGLLAALAIHETGHVLAGLAVGFRFHSMRVGRLRLTRPFQWSWSRPVGSDALGMATLFPIGTRRIRSRAFCVIVGGATANFATAGLLTAIPFNKGPFYGAFLFWSVIVGMINLASFQRGTFRSDGRRLVTLLRHPAQGRRWLALLALAGELSDGVQPESLFAVSKRGTRGIAAPIAGGFGLTPPAITRYGSSDPMR